MAWIKAISPKQVQDTFGFYNGQWHPEMDRCWIREEDGVCVCSRLIRIPEEFGGKVEHVTISRGHADGDLTITTDGSRGFTWAEKQQIKDELFGKNRVAIEVYPTEDRLVDTADVYHLWVFDKSFRLPFGIHPKEYTKAINRGYSMDQQDLDKLKAYYDRRTEKGE